jgi:hypothetical protein
MLHTGAQEVQREDIRNFPSPPAVETLRTGKTKGVSIWQPIDHEFLVRYTEKALQNQGFEITERQFGMTPQGDRFFGLMEITGNDLDGNGPTERGYSRLLGLRNSYDKSFAAGIACGARVFVCDNLSFSGDVTANHRHTKEILNKLPGMITTAISNMQEAFQFQDRRMQAYKDTGFDRYTLSDSLIELMRGSCIPAAQAVAVYDEYLKPTAEHETDSKVWNLFNAVTEVLKRVPPQEMCIRTQRLHKELDKVCDVKWIDISAHGEYKKEINRAQFAIDLEKANTLKE